MICMQDIAFISSVGATIQRIDISWSNCTICTYSPSHVSYCLCNGAYRITGYFMRFIFTMQAEKLQTLKHGLVKYMYIHHNSTCDITQEEGRFRQNERIVFCNSSHHMQHVIKDILSIHIVCTYNSTIGTTKSQGTEWSK